MRKKRPEKILFEKKEYFFVANFFFETINVDRFCDDTKQDYWESNKFLFLFVFFLFFKLLM